ncbi:hypothetical protein [Pelomonas sp. KK5]|uniref:hypothetical protein n=1 Tax=Pelomonas sp. KK5 TaxID=1855730 RepID=UPI00097BEAD6|nr:hypothetical protein [Pelomonas sp. KK5]
MSARPTALLIGLNPDLIEDGASDFAAFSGDKIIQRWAALAADEAAFAAAGYDCELGLVDYGETAEAVTAARLQARAFDCVLIGAGLRLQERHALLFERLLHVVREHAPQAAIRFGAGGA